MNENQVHYRERTDDIAFSRCASTDNDCLTLIDPDCHTTLTISADVQHILTGFVAIRNSADTAGLLPALTAAGLIRWVCVLHRQDGSSDWLCELLVQPELTP